MWKRTVLYILLSILYMGMGTGKKVLNSTDAEKNGQQEGWLPDHLELKHPGLHMGLLKKGSENKLHGSLNNHSPLHNGLFKYHPEKLGWSDANQVCMKDKGCLATAMTLDEAKAMVKILENQSPDVESVYTGFQDILKHGEFIDASGHHLASDSYVMTFLDSTPGPNKHCGTMHIAGHFSLEACDKPLSFFCRRAKPSRTHTSLAARIKNSHIVKFFRKLFL